MDSKYFDLAFEEAYKSFHNNEVPVGAVIVKNGEIISTPSHSPDSVSLILDSGACFVGDLEPIAYLDAYEENDPHKAALKEDWRRVLSFHPGHVFYAHANDVLLQTEACRI